jgi:RNA polymerase sigma-54 factor
MTPQLQQAIKLLALSNLEIETFIGDALDANPLLEIGEAAPRRRNGGDRQRQTSLEETGVDRLIGEGREEDRPLDIDATALDIDRDTGDGADTRAAPEPADGP